jgi:uroporphyrinogen-III synthase
MKGSALAHRRILVTRPDPGALGEALVAAGAEVIHLPLIAMIDPADDGAALRVAIANMSQEAWLVVTSPEGARRVVAGGSEVLQRPDPDRIRIAAVGRATAAVLEEATKRPVDLVPDVQIGTALVGAMAQLSPGSEILVAHGDLADPDLVTALENLGHVVTSVVAYRTVEVSVTPEQLSAAGEADAIVLASGSAARSWARQCGEITPPVVCAIGPSTAAVAAEVGLGVTHMAEVSSVEGIMACLHQAFDPGHPTMG